ncbi:MAG: DUF4974 domain-containing protein [Bacteroidales bacterium]|jgi:ferric-dicitrate binding protein FerR (iron transport regulator)|nr:DUF4974 domain-containing protein [Bacteroidales bacterium]MCI1786249.1 DUF4974 domain-containing protein [Bacteroidales bacterium]
MSTIDDTRDMDELIADYLTGCISADDLNVLKAFISASRENRNYFLRRREIWFSCMSSGTESGYNYEQAYERFRQRIPTTVKSAERKSVVYTVLRYAAAAALVCLFSLVSYFKGGKDIKKDFAEITIEAPSGSRTKVNLPDSSVVWLNAGSKLSYSQGFGISDRRIRLDGEGYFEVRHNPGLAFSVITDGLRVNDLGTKFDIKDYYDDTEATVTLIEGKISLNNLIKCGKENVLEPYDRAVLDKHSGIMEIKSHVSGNPDKWTCGCLVFDEARLDEIAKELERNYGICIMFSDSTLKNERFYGKFSSDNQTADDVLKALSSTGRMSFRRIGQKVTIYKGRASE